MTPTERREKLFKVVAVEVGAAEDQALVHLVRVDEPPQEVGLEPLHTLPHGDPTGKNHPLAFSFITIYTHFIFISAFFNPLASCCFYWFLRLTATS